MRAVVVVLDELDQQRRQFLRAVPRVRFEPLFQGAHEAFGDAIGAGSIGRNPHMYERHLLCESSKRFGDELRAIVTDDELQFGRRGHAGPPRPFRR